MITMPNLHAVVTDQSRLMAPAWAKFLRDLVIHANAEIAPGRVAAFEPASADVTDATKFVQAGTTQGLGVGSFLGWAYCNGNNGTTDRVAEFAAFTTLVPLMRV